MSVAQKQVRCIWHCRTVPFTGVEAVSNVLEQGWEQQYSCFGAALEQQICYFGSALEQYICSFVAEKAAVGAGSHSENIMLANISFDIQQMFANLNAFGAAKGFEPSNLENTSRHNM